MGRIFTAGFEFNSTDAGEEWSAFSNFTFVTSPVRSGTYAGRSLPTAAASTCRHNFSATNQTAPYWVRFYLRIAALPTAEQRIFSFRNTSASNKVSISLTTSGTLNLVNTEDSANVGSSSSALSLDTWYRVEMAIDTTTIASTTVEAKLNGTAFASGTINLASGLSSIIFGFDITDATADLYFDDITLNDSSGSAQNSYPGAGQIVRLKPSATGDVNTFATQTGGTAGAANNFTRVNEVNPDSTTTLNGSNTLDQEDMFECEDSGIGNASTVNVVSVIGRARNNSADATTTAKLQIKKASGGTVGQGSGITPNSNTFADFSYPTYTDPDGNPWTQSTVDTLQAGYKLTTGGTNRVEFTNLSVMVDYIEAVSTYTPSRNLSLLGVG